MHHHQLINVYILSVHFFVEYGHIDTSCHIKLCTQNVLLWPMDKTVFACEVQYSIAIMYSRFIDFLNRQDEATVHSVVQILHLDAKLPCQSGKATSFVYIVLVGCLTLKRLVVDSGWV